MAPLHTDHDSACAPHMQRGRSGMTVALAWLSAIILVLQLLGATQHHHDLKKHHADCASCVLAAQLQSPPSVDGIAEQVLRAASLQYVLPVLAWIAAEAGISKPIPRAQGPPFSTAC